MAQVAASPSPNGTTASVQKLPLFTLTAMVVGSMVGSGIFSLPSTFGNARRPSVLRTGGRATAACRCFRACFPLVMSSEP